MEISSWLSCLEMVYVHACMHATAKTKLLVTNLNYYDFMNAVMDAVEADISSQQQYSQCLLQLQHAERLGFAGH